MVEHPRLTEGDMLAMLRARYTEKAGNGDAWAFVTHVRNAAGFDASRTVDAIAMSLWPSRGLTLHGFEIKTSRADWQRELALPAKAEAFTRLVDRWWLVVADEAIVLPGELPEGWGLLAVRGRGLRCITEAGALRPEGGSVQARALPEAFKRSFLAALLRSACRSDQDALAEVRASARAEARLEVADTTAALEQTINALRQREADFEREAGVRLNSWAGSRTTHEVGAALRLVLNGESAAASLRVSLERLAEQARRIAAQADEVLAEGASADG
jgi:hypothetical protein